MTDVEIIKVLNDLVKSTERIKHCGTKRVNVDAEFLKDMLNLIQRKDEQIEGLIAGQETLQKYIAEKETEIENYSHNTKKLTESTMQLYKELEDARVGANSYRCKYASAIMTVKELQTVLCEKEIEIERLEKESADKERAYTEEYILRKELKSKLKTVEIEAVKEFVERLTDRADLVRVNAFDSKYAISQDDIDNLVKEIEDENK